MSTTKASPTRRRRANWKKWGPGLLLISPSLILVGVFVYGMIGVNINTSLLDTHTAAQVSGRKSSHVVGLENFISLFKNPNFQHSFLNLILFTIAFLAGTLVIGFLWAWLLDKPIKGEGIFRAVFLFPMAVSFVASGVVWRWLLNSAQGAQASGLNRLFEMTGLKFLENSWTQNTTFGILAIAIPAVWQLAGYVMALFLAGFRGINDDLREAARVDGANEWQLYKSIIFPQLTPIALSAVIIIGHMSLKSFDLIMSITDQRTYSTKVPAIDMFNFMTDNDYSNAAAVGTILLVVVAIAVIPYLIHDAKGRR
ncbi:MAG: sugar ABC transporter permease [Actinomyces succiniciruminis]|uniref:Sugar ABC super ATP binding cassette transporter, membrane protein n=1 Tax=Actinomyces succiniciruminis TaxID=1522002 RepID=A0A1L7RB15_9ACTO|nr:sugar ABC transporter permease [Actinomyces succiniciruminis]MBE6475577.1 sugar ABC transporter permease [Actinomyces succiniciruminis]CED91047.1 Sugar ABC super ATP binding cassette transporter, membrane protein [Actinomyces succiniciruminis]